MYRGAPRGPAAPSARGVWGSPGVSGQGLSARACPPLPGAGQAWGAPGAAPALGLGHLPGAERDRTLAGIRARPGEGNWYQTHPERAGQGCGDRNGARAGQAGRQHHGETAGAVARARPRRLSWKQLPPSGG